MSPGPSTSVLVPGLATGIGSLPHDDPRDAATVVFRVHPRLPAAPQLPRRSPLEGMLAQWARALPEIVVSPDGTIAIDDSVDLRDPVPTFDPVAHGGLIAFLDEASTQMAPRIKVQITGPLTLGVALHDAGLDESHAFARAAEATRSWTLAVERLVNDRLPNTALLLCFDEPGLVAWRESDGPIDRETAVDLLSAALAGPECVTAVHVCGPGDRRLALEAGPRLVAWEVRDDLIDDASVVARHLDADGWIAWGAVPTDRPVGESSDALWRRLVMLWCELTKRGCDPVRLRTQAIVTPACGLAGHGPSQAERALRLAREMADRVGDQTVAARLTVGA